MIDTTSIIIYIHEINASIVSGNIAIKKTKRRKSWSSFDDAEIRFN